MVKFMENMTSEQVIVPLTEEEIAIGNAIQKLVFNLADSGVPQVVNLLEKAEEYRTDSNATLVEMLIYKSLVDRFEFRPLLRDDGMKLVADRCYKTISQLKDAIDTKTACTQVVLIDAIFGFACYATEEQLSEETLVVGLPNHMRRFLIFMSKKIQDAIERKIPEKCLRRDIPSFIATLNQR
jgi:hypothetical protein